MTMTPTEQIVHTLLREWQVAPGDYLTTDQAASLIGRNSAGMRISRHRGQGPRWVRDGGRVLYRAEDLARWAAGKIPGLEYAAKNAGA